MARFILITGLIGSGKSEVAKLLRKKHYTVIDSDSEVKELYKAPNVGWMAYTTCGPAAFESPGRISLEYLRNRVLDPGETAVQKFLDYVACELIGRMLDRYRESKEAVFIEAAPTLQLQPVIDSLRIRDIVCVQAPADVRHGRVRARTKAGYSHYEVEAIDKAQSEVLEGLVDIRGLDGMAVMLQNSGGLEELNASLMGILEHTLNITDEEKSALYLRYLAESPQYCRENAWCYSFFNLGGCRECPFPCPRKDIGRKRLNEEFLREKGVQVTVDPV